MIQSGQRTRFSWLAYVLAALLLTVGVGACGEENGAGGDPAAESEQSGQSTSVGAETPEEAYNILVNAVKQKDYGRMYDLMDSSNRHYTNMWFDLNLSQMDKMDSAERAAWSQFGSIKDPRKRFQRLVEVSPMMRERFVGGYKVVNVDTVVAVVTQHAGHNRQITYFRLEDGEYKYTAPPESKVAPAAVKVQK